MAARKFTGNKIVIASHNAGKVREITDLMTPFGVDVVSAGALDLAEPVEDGDSFIANAHIKSRAAAKSSGLPALSDDSGLVVPALDGEPGIDTAFWAGPGKDFSVGMARVERELAERGVTAPTDAHFVCALSLAWPDGHAEAFEGKVYGQLTFPPRGDKGFGFDPIFIPQNHTSTFAEMNPAAKHAMSHRAHAFKQLISACFQPV